MAKAAPKPITIIRLDNTGPDPSEPPEFVSLSPSSLSFDLQGCRACWWTWHVGRTEKKPRLAIPTAFSDIARAIESYTPAKPASLMVPGCDGVIEGLRSLRSVYVVPRGCRKAIRFNGRTDGMIRCSDGTYIVPDNKTSSVKSEHVPLYQRQLQAYAFCLEHPEHGKGEPAIVSGLGLWVLSLDEFEVSAEGRGVLSGNMHWQHITWDRTEFDDFLSNELGPLVDLTSPPEPSAGCETCERRALVADAKVVLASV